MEDCLKQFTASEHIENYRCSQCLHVAAAKYLSLNVEENEVFFFFLILYDKMRYCFVQ